MTFSSEGFTVRHFLFLSQVLRIMLFIIIYPCSCPILPGGGADAPADRGIIRSVHVTAHGAAVCGNDLPKLLGGSDLSLYLGFDYSTYPS